MGKNAIIEFIGLPASGKTTISNALKDCLSSDYTVATWEDITKAYKKSGMTRMIGSFPFSILFEYLKLFLALPKSKIRKWYMYWFAIKIPLLYRFCKKYGNYDFVLIDHGVLQHMVSLLCGERPNVKFIKQLSRILYKEKMFDAYVECCVDVTTAQYRMEKRGRVNEGRLDGTLNPETRKEMFIKEQSNFEIVIKTVSELEDSYCGIQVDAKSSLDSIVSEVARQLCEK